jgi:hypothetical protein
MLEIADSARLISAGAVRAAQIKIQICDVSRTLW